MMRKRVITRGVLILILLYCLVIISCGPTDFVYVGDKTFQKQLSHLEKDAYVALILQVDPTKQRGYQHDDTLWPVIRENRLTKRNNVSDELCKLILEAIRKNQRYTGKESSPSYKVYVKYPVTSLYFFHSEKCLIFILDFKNSKVFSEGKSFVLPPEKAGLIKEKLDRLLEMKEERGTT